MRATLIHGAGDIRVEDVPDPTIHEATDALVRVTTACVCGGDLHPYHSMKPDGGPQRIGRGVVRPGGTISRVGAPQYVDAPIGFGSLFGGNITLTGGPAPARAYVETLMPGILDGTVDPGRVFDRTVSLEDVADAYRAMDEREALKVLVKP
jgi:threonine dehydrogenase-like Zn-dependent dehydrogenase